MNENQIKYLEFLRGGSCISKESFECSMCDFNYVNEAAANNPEYYELSDREFWEVILEFSKEALESL